MWGIFHFDLINKRLHKTSLMFLISLILLAGCGSDSTSPSITHSQKGESNFVARSCNQAKSAGIMKNSNAATFVCRQNIKMSFDVHGNGIAVWEVEKEKIITLVYSLYNSRYKSWSREEKLSEIVKVEKLVIFNHSVASDGPGFSVRWEQPGEENNKEFFNAKFSSDKLISIKKIESIDGYSVGLNRLISRLKSHNELKQKE